MAPFAFRLQLLAWIVSCWAPMVPSHRALLRKRPERRAEFSAIVSKREGEGAQFQNSVGNLFLGFTEPSKKNASEEFVSAFTQSFMLMCAAEIFDRTWFVTLICSLSYGAFVAFCGSISALGLHSCMSVAFGGSVAAFLPKWSMDLASAIILSGFAILYAWEGYRADPDMDAVQSRKIEAEEDVLSGGANPQEDSNSDEVPSEGGPAKGKEHAVAEKSKAAKRGIPFFAGFAAVFTTIFIAEWGDRTQIVQITLAASLPWLPVFLGTFSGLVILCLSAVVLAKFMEGKQVSERLLAIVCTISFGIMGALAFDTAWKGYLVSRAA